MNADPPLPDMAGFWLLPGPPMSKSSDSKVVQYDHRSGKYIIRNAQDYKQWKAGLGWFWFKMRRSIGLPEPQRDGRPRLKLRYCYVVPTLHPRDVTDNAASGACDSMKGILIYDDSDFWESHGTKHLCRELKECQLWLQVTLL